MIFFTRKRTLIFIASLIGTAFLLAIALHETVPVVRERFVKAIEQRFDSHLELKSVDISLFPKVHLRGEKVVLRHKGRKDVPPLISMESCSLETGWLGLLRSPLRIDHGTLNGLVIQIPAKEKRVAKNPEEYRRKFEKQKGPVLDSEAFPLVIQEVDADGTILKILPANPAKEPLVFELYKLRLRSVGLHQPMQFNSSLKNARPPGLIETTGEFGPWQKENPGDTPVSGKYEFRDADLSVFKGIAGRLSSTGEFAGVLEHIKVKGITETPDFAVQTGTPVALSTQFRATIDGTNGDTFLHPVVAHFGQTTITCEGGVIKMAGRKGKSVVLDVRLEEGRMEDVMKFVLKSQPLMTGAVTFHTKFDLPGGDNRDVVEKLHLDGTFHMGRTEFTSDRVQDRVEKLSRRSRGKTEDVDDERIASDLTGNFVLQDGTISFSRFDFAVPGAMVHLNGECNLTSEKLDLQGTIRMNATLSQTQKGVKSILLKLVDPFFKKNNAGAVIPIKITGTVKDPHVGLNFRREKK